MLCVVRCAPSMQSEIAVANEESGKLLARL